MLSNFLVNLSVVLFSSFTPFVENVEDNASLLAQLLHHESRGELNIDDGKYMVDGLALDGQMAIAEVVINRVNLCVFPNTVREVILQKDQFSHFEEDLWSLDEIPKLTYIIAFRTVALHMQGRFMITTNGSNHFHADYVDPNWNKTMKKTKQIGTHIFYRQDYDQCKK